MNNFIHLILFLALVCAACSREDNKIKTQLNISAQILDGSFSQHGEETVVRSSNTLQLENYFVWGGSVIRGKDNKYHMLFSLWESGEEWAPFQDGWLLNSKIAYARSNYPDKDFKFQKIVLKGRSFDGDATAWDAQSVHNPHLKEFKGKYYLYYTGASDPGEQPKDSPAENQSKRNRIQQNQKLGVISFNSFQDLVNGDFHRPDRPLLFPRTRVKADNVLNPSPPGTTPKPDNLIVVNPSVVYRPGDGKYLLYFKGNLWDPHWRGVHGVAIADSPTGPFTALDNFVFDFKGSDGKIASAEDPYVWFHKDHECFYATFKDFSGRITGADPGLALLFSPDGINWHQPVRSLFMKKELLFSDGKKLNVSNLERPQLLINDQGVPQVLYAACSINRPHGKRDGATFNVHIPLMSDK